MKTARIKDRVYLLLLLLIPPKMNAVKLSCKFVFEKHLGWNGRKKKLLEKYSLLCTTLACRLVLRKESTRLITSFLCVNQLLVCIQYGVHFLTSNALNKLPVSFHQVYQLLVNSSLESSDGLRILKN